MVHMYTNIPLKLALKYMVDRWDDIHIQHYTALNHKIFLPTISLCSNDSYLCLDDHFYSQIADLAMGSRLTARIFELLLKFSLLGSAPTNFTYYLYVESYGVSTVNSLLQILIIIVFLARKNCSGFWIKFRSPLWQIFKKFKNNVKFMTK